MTTSLNFHDADAFEAKTNDGVDWLKISDDRGNSIAVFMPLEAAKMLAETWKQHRGFVAPRTALPSTVTPIRRVEGY